MTSSFDILSVLLALAALVSSVADFTGATQVVELMGRLEYRPGFERFLGSIKVVGAVGLFVGLAVHAIGVAAATGFVAYFALALSAHRKIADAFPQMAPAVGLFVLSALTAVVGIAS